jgi:hypothetical protein
MRLLPTLRLLALALALLALVAGTAGCGTKTVAVTSANGQVTTRTVPNVHFAKTKFALHMGLAFGAFHHYVYEPYRAGAFRSGSRGRVKALLKAASGAVFAVHELRTARDDALSDSRLRPLAEKVERLLAKLTSLGGALKGGVLHPAAIASTAAAVSSLGAASGGLGATIKEVAPAL